MSTFSESFRVVQWFLLCLLMAVGVILFAIIYAAFSYILRKTAWEKPTFVFPSLKIAK